VLIFATSSSESGLPRLLAKMEHFGVQRSTVGIEVPTGYSFNLDGTAIYLTMAALFVGEALNKPLSLGEQISLLLLFMLIASKGTAAVSGASLATFAAGIQAHRPDLLDGVGLIVGIDRFMSEARALSNFAGNAVATVLIGVWSNTINRDQMQRTLNGERPFDEDTLGDELTENHGVPANDARPTTTRPTATRRARAWMPSRSSGPDRRRSDDTTPPRLPPSVTPKIAAVAARRPRTPHGISMRLSTSHYWTRNGRGRRCRRNRSTSSCWPTG
jgi:aerobic C4-dicarboxylate transport protein